MKNYSLKKVNSPMTVSDERWERVEGVKLDYVWPDQFPSEYLTVAKAVHCECGITVMMESNEWPLRVTHYNYGAEVCEDSCMEFFFTPNTTDTRYINFEVNPAGNTHARIGKSRHNRIEFNAFELGAKIQTLVTPYQGWRVMIFVPFSLMEELYEGTEKKMKANFYKCGDLTVKKHYSTWNPVKTDEPDYHRPEYFGTLELSDEELDGKATDSDFFDLTPECENKVCGYTAPPVELLGEVENPDQTAIDGEIREVANAIISALESFDIKAAIKSVDRGPRVTRYVVAPAPGTRLAHITNVFDDIALFLGVESLRMEAPITGTSNIGFEVPNKHPSLVKLRELIECEEFVNGQSKTTVCIGKDVAGNPIIGDISKFPHALVAGATGMGKSVLVNSLIMSLLYKAAPDEVKLLLIDPKKVEFNSYKGLPHLIAPIITDPREAAGALIWAVEEMEHRYDLIEKAEVRNIDSYNEKVLREGGKTLAKIVIVIDELNDLMMQVRDPIEDLIMRIAQKARAAGIYLIIGTQRPTPDVITGVVKANIGTRICCKVSSVTDSRVVLDVAGAEKLLNKGDMLYKPVGATKPIRVQSAFVSDNEIEAVVNFLKKSGDPEYDESVISGIKAGCEKCAKIRQSDDFYDDDEENSSYYSDQLFLDAVEIAIRAGKISTSLLQRKLSIGYGKAAMYIDTMEELGIITEPQGQKPRDVLITLDEWHEKLLRIED